MRAMWVVGDFRAASLLRLNRFGKKFLREYPAVTLKHQRIRLTEWGAATRKMLKDPYNGPEWMDLVMNTPAAAAASSSSRKNKESKEKKNRKLKKRGVRRMPSAPVWQNSNASPSRSRLTPNNE